MKFHEIVSGTAGKRPALYQRVLRDTKEHVTVCDKAGFGHPEYRSQIEGMEAPGC